MKNVSLQIQCDTLTSSLQLFKQSSIQTCMFDDLCKEDKKFLDKVNQKIDALLKFLENAT